MVRGKKMNLGEFLGERSTSFTPEQALPSGPRVRAEDGGNGGGHGGYGGDRRGGYEREPSRSEASDQWRGDRGPASDRYGGDRGGGRFGSRNDEGGSWRGGGSAGSSRYDRPSSRGGYDRETEERPAHMRLNLQRRAEGRAEGGGASDAAGGPTGSSRDDKFASAFSRRGGGVGGGNDSGSRFGGDDRYGRRDDRGYGGNRGGGRFDGPSRRDYGDNEPDTGAFSNLRVNDSQETEKNKQEQETSLSPKEDKKAKAAAMREERKRKAEEERKAIEEAKKQAAKEKKEQEEASKKKADADREIMKKILSSGKTGEALAKLAKEQFKTTEHPSGGVLFATVLAKASEIAKKSANWIAPEQYGPLLKAGMEGSSKASQVEAIYALQEFLNQYDFPKGVMEKCFMALYSFDIIDESAFFEYKYDVESNVPGRVKAIIQVSNWLTWLETPEEESDEEEDDE